MMTAAPPLPGVPPDLADLIEDAAHYLAMRGMIDPDDEYVPEDVVAELVALASAGPCGGFGCTDPLNGSVLADHWVNRKQAEYERSLPVWACDCGAVYKVLPSHGTPEAFYAIASDGTLGGPAGGVRRTAKGVVKHTDQCPACGRPYADTIARQADPQGSLF